MADLELSSVVVATSRSIHSLALHPYGTHFQRLDLYHLLCRHSISIQESWWIFASFSLFLWAWPISLGQLMNGRQRRDLLLTFIMMTASTRPAASAMRWLIRRAPCPSITCLAATSAWGTTTISWTGPTRCLKFRTRPRSTGGLSSIGGIGTSSRYRARNATNTMTAESSAIGAVVRTIVVITRSRVSKRNFLPDVI